MSWWVYLVKPEGHVARVPTHAEGGTFPGGGIPKAELNVTYNYSSQFKEALHEDSLWWLDGKQASEVVADLKDAVDELGTDQHDDYWKDTPGNAGHALSTLAEWAEHHPDATFEVS